MYVYNLVYRLKAIYSTDYAFSQWSSICITSLNDNGSNDKDDDNEIGGKGDEDNDDAKERRVMMMTEK